jgi:hypothetical protein
LSLAAAKPWRARRCLQDAIAVLLPWVRPSPAHGSWPQTPRPDSPTKPTSTHSHAWGRTGSPGGVNTECRLAARWPDGAEHPQPRGRSPGWGGGRPLG